MGYDDYHEREVPFYSLTCGLCGAQHGDAPSRINKWHVCKSCGAVYCPDCGRELQYTVTHLGRNCHCGGSTRLV
jgi:hypothetical protein